MKAVSYFCHSSTEEKPKKRAIVKWHDATLNLQIREFRTAQKFIEKCIEHIPRHIQKNLLSEYVKRTEAKEPEKPVIIEVITRSGRKKKKVVPFNPVRSANIYLRKVSSRIQTIIRRLPFDNKDALRRDDVLEHEARICAAFCLDVVLNEQNERGEYHEKLVNTLSKIDQFARRRGVRMTINNLDNVEAVESAIIRYVCEDWWGRKFERIRAQTLEYINIAAGYVGKGLQEYASNQCVSAYRAQRAANDAYLAMMDVVNAETLEAFSLKEIADKTTANPELRRIELMVRCRGLEELAEDLDYQAFFVTWTAPSKYHKASKKWNGSKPNETQRYLCGQWAKCRAAIAREDIKWFGVRVAEPHTDATPHWHMLVFASRAAASVMQRTMSAYALEHDSDESGALKHRFTVEEIDTSKGSATGYIAKYIAKNINAENIKNEPDYDGTGSLHDAVSRVSAWASRWCIRQFQFFGAAQVSIWRECRRIKNSVECQALEAVRLAADSSKWAEFTKALKSNPLSLQYGTEAKNRYGETVKKISGLLSLSSMFELITRDKVFRLEKRRAAALSGGSRAPWSPVNNCTGINDSLKRACKLVGIDKVFINPLLSGARIVDRGRGFRVSEGQLLEFAP